MTKRIEMPRSPSSDGRRAETPGCGVRVIATNVRKQHRESNRRARMTTPAIELRNATKRFGSLTALRDVSLTVQAGETVAMLGPNGAGKTTAVSLMLGMRKPSAGSALLFGADPRVPAARLRLGAMLQES